MSDSYFTIGFNSEACETADTIVGRLAGLTVEITTVDGQTADYELVGVEHDNPGDYDGHPVKVKAWDGDQGEGVGPVIRVDAKHIFVY